MATRTKGGAKAPPPEEKVQADIAKYGWHVVSVLSGSGNEAPFAYTIGLEKSYEHPEIVIFGLNDDLEFMHRILNDIGVRVKEGERFEHGAKKKGILTGYVCPFARFPRVAYDDHLGRALAFYGSDSFDAVQCIWPDPKKHLPWDDRVMLPILARQPVFLRPEAGPRDPEWPFEEGHCRLVATSRQVAIGEEPIRLVSRDGDGDWQFVCQTTKGSEDVVATTLGWVFDHDPSVRAAAKLRPGQRLERSSHRGKWKATSKSDE